MSIWQDTRTPQGPKNKANISWSTWRMLLVEEVASRSGRGEFEATRRISRLTIAELGIAYDDNKTVEEVAFQLS